MRLRRSARVLLFDSDGRLLLIRFAAPRDQEVVVFWVTPGGEIEPGEDDRASAARELQEALGVSPPLQGPVHRAAGGIYTHLGETVRNDDVFFVAECASHEPRLLGVTAEEIGLMQEVRWWAPEELEASGASIYPKDLAALARSSFATLKSV